MVTAADALFVRAALRMRACVDARRVYATFYDYVIVVRVAALMRALPLASAGFRH